MIVVIIKVRRKRTTSAPGNERLRKNGLLKKILWPANATNKVLKNRHLQKVFGKIPFMKYQTSAVYPSPIISRARKVSHHPV